MIATVILSGFIGLLAGLLWCYWKQIRAAYDNRDVISKGSTAVGAAQEFIDSLRTKL